MLFYILTLRGYINSKDGSIVTVMGKHIGRLLGFIPLSGSKISYKLCMYLEYVVTKKHLNTSEFTLSGSYVPTWSSQGFDSGI